LTKQFQGLKINYIEKGAGRDLLLLHGWGSNIKLFQHIIDCMEKSHRVIALDMPGFGGSDEPPCSWNLDNYVDFVIAFAKEMNCKDLVLLGHSFGGRIIIKMANRKDLPFTISKIVLTGSARILPPKTMKKRLKIFIYKTGKKLLSLPPVKALFPEALEQLQKRSGSSDYRNASPVMRETLVKVVNEDLKPLLPSIKYPTLLIWGDADNVTPISDAKCMEELIPDAGLVIVKGGSHYAFAEQPFFVNKVLQAFLND